MEDLQTQIQRLQKQVKEEVNKINISSDIKDAFYQQLRKTLGNDPVIREPFDLYLEVLMQ